MDREFISEYGLEPTEYVRRLSETFRDRLPEMESQSVEGAFFVDDGPVEYLVWTVLEGYENHVFFYLDDSPDEKFVRQLLLASPTEAEMTVFDAFLRSHFETYAEIDTIAVLEIRDTYLPQFGERPRAILGICYNPVDDRIITGVSGIPRTREQEIFDDMNKLVPDRSFEKFITKTVQMLHDEIEVEADRHTIDADLCGVLESDEDFTFETTKDLPSGIHPRYTDEPAELWQKPASRVDYVEGAQGFLQIWIPVGEEDITLIDVTAGEYDRDEVVDAVREEFEVVLKTS